MRERMRLFGRKGESSVDGAQGPVLEPPQPGSLARTGAGGVAGANPRRRRIGSNHRSQFSLLIVRGDGSRVIRLNIPRPTAVGAGVAIAAVVTLTGVMMGDWVQLREAYKDAATFHEQIAEQRNT